MKAYADTNFLTRLYLLQPESPQAERALRSDQPGPPLPITWLHRIELANALELSVWLGRQGTHRAVSPQQAAVALSTFEDDLRARSFLAPASPPIADLENAFEQIAQRHTARYGFRTSDILHVASAVLLGCDSFLTFDVKARKLATLEGLGSGERTDKPRS